MNEVTRQISSRSPEQYAHELLFQCEHDNPELQASVYYGPLDGPRPASCKLHIVASPFFSPYEARPSALPALPLEIFEDMPLLYGRSQIQRENGIVILYADLLASAYVLATDFEARVQTDQCDQHGRFPGNLSLAHRAGFMQRPIVDEYRAWIQQHLKDEGIILPTTVLQKPSFTVTFSHDVDSPFLRTTDHLCPSNVRIRIKDY